MGKRIYHPIHERLFQQRPGGNFYTYVGGEERSLETSDLKKALARLEFLDDSVSFFGAAGFKKTVGELFPEFLKTKKKDVRDSTYRGYENIWRTFQRAGLHKLHLAKVNQKTWVKFCESSSHEIEDFQTYKNLLHQFLVWCTLHGYIRAVVVLKNPKHVRRRRKIIPPNHAVMIFTAAQKSRGSILLYLTLLALHGPRGGEMRKLKKRFVDFDRSAAQLTGETVKTGEEREISLHPTAVALLRVQINRHERAGIKSEYFFANAKSPKRPMSDTGFKTAWRTCLRRAGLTSFGYTMHDWRATYEKWLEMSSLNEIQKDKASGASAEVRRKIYVRNLSAEDLRGAEDVVKIPELIELLQNETLALSGAAGFIPEGDAE